MLAPSGGGGFRAQSPKPLLQVKQPQGNWECAKPSTQRFPQEEKTPPLQPHPKTSHEVRMRKGARQPQKQPRTLAGARMLPLSK